MAQLQLKEQQEQGEFSIIRWPLDAFVLKELEDTPQRGDRLEISLRNPSAWSRRELRVILVHSGGRVIASAATSASAVTPALSAPSESAFSVLRIGGLVSFGIIVGFIPVLLGSVGAALLGMFLGISLFCLTNYAAYRAGEQNVIVGPGIAAVGSVGFLLLALVMLIALVAG